VTSQLAGVFTLDRTKMTCPDSYLLTYDGNTMYVHDLLGQVNLLCFFWGGGQLVPLHLLSPPFFDYSLTLSTKMTGISLHMKWPLTSQLHGSILKENYCFLLRIKPHTLIQIGVFPPCFRSGKVGVH
jgi:hypothetical protein